MHAFDNGKAVALLYHIQADGSPAENWPVGDQALVVGRGEFANANVDDDALSRSHFMVVREGKDFFVVDLDSQNGTSVNGKRIAGHKLHPGDVIRAGDSLFYFSAERLPLHARPLAAAAGLERPASQICTSGLIQKGAQ